MTLGSDARAWLLDWARRSIARHLVAGVASEPEDAPDGALVLRACFVSLHGVDGVLRGCIGTFSADEPLWRNVHDMAVAAATRDPRFEPVSREELERCRLVISVLSPSRVATADEVEVGRHGVTVRRGRYRGVLLPQVASERGWNRETFLEHTCRKAGLAAGAWRDPATTIEVFTAEVFEEDPDPEAPPR